MAEAIRAMTHEQAGRLREQMRQPMRALDEREVGDLKAHRGRNIDIVWISGELLQKKAIRLEYVNNYALCGYDAESGELSNQIFFLGSTPIVSIRLAEGGNERVIYDICEKIRTEVKSTEPVSKVLRT